MADRTGHGRGPGAISKEGLPSRSSSQNNAWLRADEQITAPVTERVCTKREPTGRLRRERVPHHGRLRVGAPERAQRGCLSRGVRDLPEFVCGSDRLVWIRFGACERASSLAFGLVHSAYPFSSAWKQTRGLHTSKKKKKSPPPSAFQPATISLFFSTISLLESITFKATFTSYRPFIPSHSVRLTSTESVSVEVTGDLLVDCLVSLHVGRDRASFMNHRVPCCQPDACAQLALRKSWMNVL